MSFYSQILQGNYHQSLTFVSFFQLFYFIFNQFLPLAPGLLLLLLLIIQIHHVSLPYRCCCHHQTLVNNYLIYQGPQFLSDDRRCAFLQQMFLPSRSLPQSAGLLKSPYPQSLDRVTKTVTCAKVPRSCCNYSPETFVHLEGIHPVNSGTELCKKRFLIATTVSVNRPYSLIILSQSCSLSLFFSSRYVKVFLSHLVYSSDFKDVIFRRSRNRIVDY